MMPNSTVRIRFPILTRLDIRDYQLYPGEDGHGFAKSILPGVNLIIGINGLGKTTLLNAIFRVMSGPVDWKSRPFDKKAGSTSTALGKWKTREFFVHRVLDRAKDATISADLAFGENTISITRRLSDLAINSLVVNEVPRSNTEKAYQAAVCEFTGLPDFSDFYLVLRYLIFFLEDRQAVVWDKTAQADALRVLFYSSEGSAEARELFDRIQELDSQYRNKRVPYNLAVDELETARAAQATNPELQAKYRSVLTELQGYEAREQDAREELNRLEGEYVRRLRLLKQKQVEIEEEIREYERLEQRYLGAIFPDLDRTVEYVFAHLGSGGGCLMCGNRSAHAPARLARFHDSGECPICEAPLDQQERVVPGKELEDRRLEGVYARIGEYRQNIASVIAEVQEVEAARDEHERAVLQLREQIQVTREERDRLQPQVPPDEDRISGLQDFVERREKELQDLKSQRARLDAQFREIQRIGEAAVSQRVEQIKERFKTYAEHFLADDCSLEYTRDTRKIGQESESQRFPLFTVRLSSGVFHHSQQPRREAHEVSESQKEFIDLAFRMALITVASEADPAMIIIETPEASLDAVFILRAGFLLAQFAAGGGATGNRLIASSNLNRTEMIPTLFGYFRPEDRDALPPGDVPLIAESEREDRVIDLLQLAEETTALLEHRPSYERKREQALYPERFVDVVEPQRKS